MITPYKLAVLSDAIYDSASKAFTEVWTDNDVVCGVTYEQNAPILVLRGSIETVDFVRDAEAVPVWHESLGFVHAGFIAGMDQLFERARTYFGPEPVILTGHSLGGARARLLAALFLSAGLPVTQVTVFGSPKPGFANCARILQKSGIIHTSFRNRNDIVPELPLGSLWQHPDVYTPVSAPPADANFAPLRDHSCDLYVTALQPLEGAS